jgi:transposase InsO family protein
VIRWSCFEFAGKPRFGVMAYSRLRKNALTEMALRHRIFSMMLEWTSAAVDAWSCRVVGWSMETHMRIDLVLQALSRAVSQRRPTTSFIIATKGRRIRQ